MLPTVKIRTTNVRFLRTPRRVFTTEGTEITETLRRILNRRWTQAVSRVPQPPFKICVYLYPSVVPSSFLLLRALRELRGESRIRLRLGRAGFHPWPKISSLDWLPSRRADQS